MARARTVHGLKPKGAVRANARKIIAVRTGEFFALAPFLTDPANVAQLHDMRIAAKRLRYALELFVDVLDAEAAACIDLIKEFQDVVGDIHDHDVHVDILRDHLEAISAEHARALACLAVEMEGEIVPLKERCRAFAIDEAWVVEQTAIAAAIARTAVERRERHTDLVARWTEWNAAGLGARLEALGTD
jgi:hypothetical protein